MKYKVYHHHSAIYRNFHFQKALICYSVFLLVASSDKVQVITSSIFTFHLPPSFTVPFLDLKGVQKNSHWSALQLIEVHSEGGEGRRRAIA